jgi:hypothetical protein
MRDFRQIRVWLKAHELTLEVYRQPRGFRVKNYMALLVNSDVLRLPYPQISLRGLGGAGILSSRGFYRWEWDRLTRLNITRC